MSVILKREKALPRFQHVEPSPLQYDVLASVNEAAEDLERAIMEMCPDGRYRAAGFTLLEQAVMFFRKSVTHEGVEHSVDGDA